MSSHKISTSHSNIIKSNEYISQSFGFVTKEKYTLKNGCSLKISMVNLQPYLNQNFGFIDPDFPHVQSSISESTRYRFEIDWVKAEEVHQNGQSNYSQSINSLEEPTFSRKSISHALLIMNWFANEAFSQIFSKQLNKLHLYQFDIMMDGIFIRVPIDSYIPINKQTNEEVFSKKYHGSIFPCLYEKMLAKVYGNFQAITSEMIEIVEMQTMYCREDLCLTQKMQLSQLQKCIQKSIQSKSIVGFRTRNSIRMQSLGLQPNYLYIITKVITIDKEILLEFLEIDGQKWIGKFSKLRSNWHSCLDSLQRQHILIGSGFRENYISISDMRGLSRQLTILHNTSSYHKTYITSNSKQNLYSYYKMAISDANRVMIRVNYKKKKCYNSIFIVRQVIKNQSAISLGVSKKNFSYSYQIVKFSFKESKECNFIQAEIDQGVYYIVVYNEHLGGEGFSYAMTVFSSKNPIQLNPIASNSGLNIFEDAMVNYIERNSIQDQNKQIFIKNYYEKMGMCFILINLKRSFLKKVQITINMDKITDNRTYIINKFDQKANADGETTLLIQNGDKRLLMFKCLWRKSQALQNSFDLPQIEKDMKQNLRIPFPPKDSLHIYMTK